MDPLSIHTRRSSDLDHTIEATFAITQHTIAASAGANGSITPSGSVAVNDGDSQSFTIAADAHYHILDVKVDGVSVGAVASYNFSDVVADHTVGNTVVQANRR